MLAAFGAAPPAPAAAKEAFAFPYLQREYDAAYEAHPAYTGLVLRDRRRLIDGAKAALRESRVMGGAIGAGFELVERSLDDGDDAVAAIEGLAAQGVGVFVLDLPLENVTRAGAALAARNLLLFNIRHRANALRGAGCSPVLFHTIPSDAMLMDALAQYLFKKTWTEVLLLEGEAEADKASSAAVQDAARKSASRSSMCAPSCSTTTRGCETRPTSPF